MLGVLLPCLHGWFQRRVWDGGGCAIIAIQVLGDLVNAFRVMSFRRRSFVMPGSARLSFASRVRALCHATRQSSLTIRAAGSDAF